DATYSPTFTQTVTTATTTTAAANAATDFSATDHMVPVSATVTATPPAPVMTAPAPTVDEGTVTFNVFNSGGTQVATATINVTGGQASGNLLLPANTPTGTYQIVATYNPGPDFQTSNDQTHTLVVNSDMTFA